MLTAPLFGIAHHNDMNRLKYMKPAFKNVCDLSLKNRKHTTDNWIPSFNAVFHRTFFCQLLSIFCSTEVAALNFISEFREWLWMLPCFSSSLRSVNNVCLTCSATNIRYVWSTLCTWRLQKNKSFSFQNQAEVYSTAASYFCNWIDRRNM